MSCPLVNSVEPRMTAGSHSHFRNTLGNYRCHWHRLKCSALINLKHGWKATLRKQNQENSFSVTVWNNLSKQAHTINKSHDSDHHMPDVTHLGNRWQLLFFLSLCLFKQSLFHSTHWVLMQLIADWSYLRPHRTCTLSALISVYSLHTMDCEMDFNMVISIKKDTYKYSKLF